MIDTTNEDELEYVLSLVPQGMREKLLRTPRHLISMDIEELRTHFYNGKISTTDHQLRNSFWKEFHNPDRGNGPIIMAKVVKGICSYGHFGSFFIGDPVRCAFLLKPISSDEKAFDEIGTLAVEKLRELVSLPYMDKEGHVNAKTAAVVLRAVEMALNRSKGAVVEVVHQKNMNVNLNKNMDNAIEIIPETVEEIEAEIRRLEQKERVKHTKPETIVIGKIEIKND